MSKLDKAFVVATAIALVVALGHATPRPAAEAPQYTEPQRAAMACQQLALKQLHDPASAEFPAWSEVSVRRVQESVYDAAFRARARNGFGALRLATFRCRVAHLADNTWVLLALRQD